MNDAVGGASEQSGAAEPDPDVLEAALAAVSLRDEYRLRRRLDAARRARDEPRRTRGLADVAAAIAGAQDSLARRRAITPKIHYPDDLPISARREEILDALQRHQVVIVAGATGSGKTTQIPKMLLESGRGIRGVIGHTQPRRIAARAVAERLAEETGTPLGEGVGYTVRFADESSADTLIRVMTDGILLAEIQRDRQLRRYDALVIDEAHERSLNIDFLLGYLNRLLPSRPDLSLVVTSATIDPEAFSRYFGGAPIVEVSGRSYPVEIRYRPLVDPDDPESEDRDQVQGITDAVAELGDETRGDILVFCSGEREIRDAAEALADLPRTHRRLRGAEVLPLYGRLSAAEQHRVFAPHSMRRIILATNVAETSLTVPGIRSVVDTGTARISRYSQRLKVQRLPIEAISRASADQRAGRCGREAPGICIRLYTQADYEARPRFTDPEIQRTHLASVMLAMAALDLGEVETFGFLDPPDRRQIRDGLAMLEELGALEPTSGVPRLTAVGRRLAQLPVDPRLGRMILAAADAGEGCLADVIVVVATLSIQDVREWPVDQRPAAAEKHRRFVDDTSDFLGLLNLWRYLREQQDDLSGSAFRRMCRADFLHYLRVREWQDLVTQIRRAARDLGLSPGPQRATATTVDADALHGAILAGLLSHVGSRDARSGDYQGARGARFSIHPSSALARRQPPLVVAAELVDTGRLWARDCARVEPELVERAAAHVVKRTYSEPRWSSRRGAAVVTERVTLYGVPLVVGRTVALAGIDPVLARELFIRHALVEGDWTTSHRFVRDNAALVSELSEVEQRARRRDLLVDDDVLVDFFDRRVPAEVVSTRHFDAWWAKRRRSAPDLLSFTPDLLLRAEGRGISGADFPGTWTQDGVALDVTYQFAPGTPEDGVVVTIPVAVLNRLSANGFDWQVPGRREELVLAMLRALAKPVRTRLVPLPDTAREILAALPVGPPNEVPQTTLVEAVAAQVWRLRGVAFSAQDLDPSRIPEHLVIRFRVVDATGAVLGQDTDLDRLRAHVAGHIRAEIAQAATEFEREDVDPARLPELPKTVEVRRGDLSVQGFPALTAEGERFAVRVLSSPEEQGSAMRDSMRALLLRTTRSAVTPGVNPGGRSVARLVSARLAPTEKLALSANPHGSVPALLADCQAAAVDMLVERAGGPAWDSDGLARLAAAVGPHLDDAAVEVVRSVAQILTLAGEVRTALSGLRGPSVAAGVADVQAHLDRLVSAGFVTRTGAGRLSDLQRYLRGMLRRLDRMAQDPGRDAALMEQAHAVENEVAAAIAELPARLGAAGRLAGITWMLEEFRVSLFAQTLRTAYPVSAQRIRRVLDELRSV